MRNTEYRILKAKLMATLLSSTNPNWASDSAVGLECADEVSDSILNVCELEPNYELEDREKKTIDRNEKAKEHAEEKKKEKQNGKK